MALCKDDYRLLDGQCLGCLGESTLAQSLTLSTCMTVHNDPDKQCKHCPVWHHLCLSKLSSENIEKCNWCNSQADLGNPDEATLPLATYLAVGHCLARDQREMDAKEFYVHTMILATRLEKEWKYTFPFTVDAKEKVVLTFPAESFFSDMMKQGLQSGKVALHKWPQPPSPGFPGEGEDSGTHSDEVEREDVGGVDESGEQEEQFEERATGGQCAAPTPASDQTLAPAAGVPPSLPSTSAQQGANRNPAPGNTTSSTSDHLRMENLVQGDIVAVPLDDGSFKLGRLRRIRTFEGETQVAVALGEDGSPFGFMRVTNYKILECLSVTSDGGIKGGSVVVHSLAEVKSPVSEVVHENKYWETFGIPDFKLLGHEFFFHHR